MTAEQIFKALSEQFPDAKIDFVEAAKLPVTHVTSGDSSIIVPAEKIIEIGKFLKSKTGLDFDCLSSLTAVDKKETLEVVYHLFSYRQKHSVTLKAVLARNEDVHIHTVEEIWATANWLEREVYDLFGIKFDGHTDLRRIMLPDDWKGHPLRKDYKEEEDYHGISTTRASLLQ